MIDSIENIHEFCGYNARAERNRVGRRVSRPFKSGIDISIVLRPRGQLSVEIETKS